MTKRKEEQPMDANMANEMSDPMASIPAESLPGLMPTDRMAKARAAKVKRGKVAGHHAQPISEVEWSIIGVKKQGNVNEVVTSKKNRFQLAKTLEHMRPLLDRIYDELYVIRGKRFHVDDM